MRDIVSKWMRGMSRRVSDSAEDDCGQMVVELALAIPVSLILLLIVVNIFYFLEGSARFDQLAPQAIVSCTIETSAADPTADISSKITSRIADELGENSRLSVAAEEVRRDKTFLVLGERVTYRCEMHYVPWPAPRAFSIAGVSTGTLSIASRERTFTIDTGSPEVVF